jgi:hypothetical protein
MMDSLISAVIQNMCDNAGCVFIYDRLVTYPVYSHGKWINHLDIKD